MDGDILFPFDPPIADIHARREELRHAFADALARGVVYVFPGPVALTEALQLFSEQAANCIAWRNPDTDEYSALTSAAEARLHADQLFAVSVNGGVKTSEQIDRLSTLVVFTLDRTVLRPADPQ